MSQPDAAPLSPLASQLVAGRRVPRIYRTDASRDDIHGLVLQAVEASGAKIIFESAPRRVPIFVAAGTPEGERIGLLIYPFRFTERLTKKRPANEVRGQLRYGGESSWGDEDHFIAKDIAGVDTTLLLGVNTEARVFVGLDPDIYDPMPLGISIYAKKESLSRAVETGWFVWERENRAGAVRAAPRTADGLETLVAFSPERLLDYARLQRRASELGLDAALRYVAAQDLDRVRATSTGSGHALESMFGLDAAEILDVIAGRMRLAVAVKGGIAEHHLERQLRAHSSVASVERLDRDGQPDFNIVLSDGRCLQIECKNVSPHAYANGDLKVEVQKTRATAGDPAGRLYRPSQFDLVAACVYSVTGSWDFRFRRTSDLLRHSTHPDRLSAMQRVDAAWAHSLEAVLDDADDTSF